ncbi:MAG: DUF1641 domain-containing protein [Bacteroidales bacterium]
MEDKNIQLQIDRMNEKLDIILEESAMQKRNRDTVTDLVDDLSLVSRDAFKSMVDGLDNAGIEVDGEEFNHLILNFIRNINNVNMLFHTMESITDLVKDISPVIKQIGTDATDKFNEFDEKGYFEVLNQVSMALETIMSRYSKNDLHNLSDNIITAMDAILAITDPVIMKKVTLFAGTFRELDQKSVPEYSIWKVMREMNKPEMKKSLGFIMTFMKMLNEDKSKQK